MGTLSGVLTMLRKCSSVNPNKKKANKLREAGMATLGDVMVLGNVMNSQKMAMPAVKIEAGDEISLIKCLKAVVIN